MDADAKNCPYCGEEILAVATKCKHCKEFLNDRNQSDRNYVLTLQSKNCSIAIASFVLAMVSIVFGFTCIPAIICGHIAILRCNSEPSLQGRGYAVASLIVGYIILTFWVLVGFCWLGLIGCLISCGVE